MSVFIILIFVLFINAVEEFKFSFTWTKDGVSQTSLITQDVVSRYANDAPSRTAPINYTESGVSVSDDGKSLTQYMYKLNDGWANEWGSRLYLLNKDEVKYEIFDLVNKEFSFDVELSTLSCGFNSALYTVEMPATGSDDVGASYGTGYCDAQGGGPGNINLACNEMDLIEANRESAQLAVHSCSEVGQFALAEGKTCATAGCSVNHYRDQPSFFGPNSSFSVDTSRVFTVVTQFFGSDDGKLNEIRRFYIQDGVQISSPAILVPSSSSSSSSYPTVTNGYCTAANADSLLDGMSRSFGQGHVLVFSLWAAEDAGGMDWLDAGHDGRCPEADADTARAVLVQANKEAHVTWSNVRVGDVPKVSDLRPNAKRNTGTVVVVVVAGTVIVVVIIVLPVSVFCWKRRKKTQTGKTEGVRSFSLAGEEDDDEDSNDDVQESLDYLYGERKRTKGTRMDAVDEKDEESEEKV